MKPCKRIEIVVEEAQARRLADLLETLDAPGYTMLTRASGDGDRGVRRADDPTGTFTNCVFIIACQGDSEVDRITEAIRPLIKRSGGMCLISDAMWLKH